MNSPGRPEPTHGLAMSFSEQLTERKRAGSHSPIGFLVIVPVQCVSCAAGSCVESGEGLATLRIAYSRLRDELQRTADRREASRVAFRRGFLVTGSVQCVSRATGVEHGEGLAAFRIADRPPVSG